MIAALSDAAPPPLSGFVESAFGPLVYQAVERCLTARPGDGSRTALVLASALGDAASLDAGSRLLVAGQVHNALLFVQSTANAILGRLACDFALTGPLIPLSTAGDCAADLLATAELLLADPADDELDRVVLVGVELAARSEGTERAAAAHRGLGTRPPQTDLAVAIVLDRGDPLPVPSRATPSVPAGAHGNLRGLVELAARIQGTTS